MSNGPDAGEPKPPSSGSAIFDVVKLAAEVRPDEEGLFAAMSMAN